MRKKSVWLVITIIVIVTLGKSYFKKNEAAKSELIIFHAGSLSIPFREVCRAFGKNNPEIIIKTEAAGSRACARKITDLGRRCDVLASADYRVIESLLMRDLADFNIKFALNEMVIAYNDKAQFSDEINPNNWYDILLKDEVMFGRSEPNLDPCGYRTLQVFQLAESFYRKPGLAEKLYEKDVVLRPKETDLLALLETGEMDYLFIYRSVAQQHGLKMLLLPDKINLKTQRFTDFYNSAKVKLSGKKPGEFIIRKGEPMIYSVTIPRNAENKKDAEKWVEFLLSPQGRKIMEKHGQSCITPAKADGFDKLPQSLKILCQ